VSPGQGRIKPAGDLTARFASQPNKPMGSCFVDLYWIPVAAGTLSRFRHWSLACWEASAAILARRPRAKLYHSALKIGLPSGDIYTLELTPVFAGETVPPLMTGPVGIRGADRIRIFRYQMRCHRSDRLPDEEWAVGAPVRLADDCATSERILRLAPTVPPYVWGLRAPRTKEMWTSDSAISWLLVRSGIDPDQVAMPPGGRAPGWFAGIQAARS
jgi:hypothetical protein